jgi:hypothetical protein
VSGSGWTPGASITLFECKQVQISPGNSPCGNFVQNAGTASATGTFAISFSVQQQFDAVNDGDNTIWNCASGPQCQIVAADFAANQFSAQTITFGAQSEQIPPTITCPEPVPTFLLHEPDATVTATVEDTGGSGAGSPTVSASVSTATVGDQTVELTAQDNAGNSTTETCHYQVSYAFTGFSAPVNNAEANSAKAGRIVPLKWRISDYFGVGVDDSSSFVTVTSSSTACSTLGPPDAIETYAGSSGLQYLGDGSWSFNWMTSKGYAGHCRQVSVNLADGTSHTADFVFN